MGKGVQKKIQRKFARSNQDKKKFAHQKVVKRLYGKQEKMFCQRLAKKVHRNRPSISHPQDQVQRPSLTKPNLTHNVPSGLEERQAECVQLQNDLSEVDCEEHAIHNREVPTYAVL